MDFGLLPPEVNSARMYAGPGAGPMLAAAAAWDGLAAQLHLTAASYSSEISGLAAGWQGPSSATMTTAITPYVGWLGKAAAQAEQSAAQARAAASELAVRAAAALAVRDGSKSISADQHAQRLAREALFLLVFGLRPAIKSALLRRFGAVAG